MKPGLYRVKLHGRWTIAEYVAPIPNDEVAYWVVLGSEEEFDATEFEEIGSRVRMPENF